MDTTQLARIEGLGDNCELGFVLRRLGHNSGGLFRWASMKPTQLLAMLEADLSGIYRFDELEPLRLAMVLDRRYGVGWHTDMKSEHTPGAGLAFRDGERARRSIHRREKRKLDYLIAKFRARARAGGIVFVIKSNAGIEPDVADRLHAELAALCAGAPFAFLEVAQTSDPSRVGTLSREGDNRFKGHVAAFASYDRADEGDTEVWFSLLSQVLALSPCPDWEERLAAAQASIPDHSVALPFPASEATAADVRLLGGNEWCRTVEAGFRIHGALPAGPGTTLQWSPFPLRGIHHLSGTVRSAVPDAAPVAVTVRTRNSGRTDVRERRSVVTPDAPWLLDFVIDPDDPDDVVLEIDVEATRPLQQGERAVVDVSPLTLHPAER